MKEKWMKGRKRKIKSKIKYCRNKEGKERQTLWEKKRVIKEINKK